MNITKAKGKTLYSERFNGAFDQREQNKGEDEEHY